MSILIDRYYIEAPSTTGATMKIEVATTEILAGIAKGEQAIRDGRTMDASKAKVKMSKWLK
jgi:hypothetical protein